MTAGNPLSRFVDTQLGPSDMIGVMHPLDSVDSVRMTRNHSIITRAIQQFRGRKFDYQPQNEFEQRYANYPAETVEQIRNQVSLSAMKALIVHMGGSEGRPQGADRGQRGLLEHLAAAAPRSDCLDTRVRQPESRQSERRRKQSQRRPVSLLRRPGPRVLHAGRLRGGEPEQRRHLYRRSSRSARRSSSTSTKASARPIDSSYLRSAQETLRALALETDGRAILNRNDLDVGMKQIMRDSSAYYLLGYTSPQVKTDGKFHAINVRVKRPGVQVRAAERVLGDHAGGGHGDHGGRREAGRGAGNPGGAVDRRSAGSFPRGEHLDRHVARRERKDQGHLRLGAGGRRRPGATAPTARRRHGCR